MNGAKFLVDCTRAYRLDTVKRIAVNDRSIELDYGNGDVERIVLSREMDRFEKMDLLEMLVSSILGDVRVLNVEDINDWLGKNEEDEEEV